MIETKPKPCKAIGKANGFESCGKPTLKRTFGMCSSCYYSFLTTDERGKIIYAKQFLPKVSKITEKREKETAKEQRFKLLTADNYRAKYLQPCINKIARLIDFGQPCIATGKFGKMAGGHCVAVGSNRTTALNLHNIHIQSYESNGPSGGDNFKYRQGLRAIYSEEYLNFVEGLQKTPVLRLKKDEMVSIYQIAKKIENRLSKTPEKRCEQDRIKLRNEINIELGIYPPEFSVFNG